MPGLSYSTWNLWSLMWQVGSNSLTRDRTWAPSTGNMEFEPLDHQGSPQSVILQRLSALMQKDTMGLWSQSGVRRDGVVLTHAELKLPCPYFCSWKTHTVQVMGIMLSVHGWLQGPCLNPDFIPGWGSPGTPPWRRQLSGSGLTADLSVSPACLSLKDTVGPRPGFPFHHLLGGAVGKNSVVTLHCLGKRLEWRHTNNWNKVHTKCNVLESTPNHPLPLTLVHGKIVFHETHPWCQKDWGSMLQAMWGCHVLFLFLPILSFRTGSETNSHWDVNDRQSKVLPLQGNLALEIKYSHINFKSREGISGDIRSSYLGG